jgi:uncharacterized phage-like protein YoqJ
MITKTACFTGHRHLLQEKQDSLSLLIDQAISEAYKDNYRRFLCGGALGFDTLAATRIILFRKEHPDIKLTLVVPCENQSLHWCKEDQSVYRHIREQADEVIILSPLYYQGCMQTRNRYMVDHSSLCICYLFSFRGGTAYTVRYAAYCNIDIINLAMDQSQTDFTLRENQCSSTFMSRSANKNAVTAHSFLLQGRKLRKKNMLSSC